MGIRILNGNTRFFVCEVTREDLKERGWSPAVDDSTMTKIATEVSKVITFCDFWTALDHACEKYSIQKL